MKIFISGDFAPTLRVVPVIKEDSNTIFGDILPLIQEADVAITNLESPLIEDGTPIAKTGPNLCAPIICAKALKDAGFGLVTLANNHIMDYGKEGLESTIENCRKYGIDYVGAGICHDEICRPFFYKKDDCTLGIISFCENEWSTAFIDGAGANPLNEVSLYYQIKEVKEKADIVIVIPHGGHEMFEYPSLRQRNLYRWIIDLGADAVVGHHTHCFSGYENYNNRLIIYSLGNFVFDSKLRNSIWNSGAVVSLDVSKDNITYKIYPIEQCNDIVGVKKLDFDQESEWNDKNKIKESIIKDDRLLNEEFERFFAKMKDMYEDFVNPVNNKYYCHLVRKGWMPRMIKGYKKRLYYDIIRCEAHRDMLLKILK